MRTIPRAMRSVFVAWAMGFTRPTFQRFVALVKGALMTTGDHTISNVLRTAGELMRGDPSTWHRVLSQRVWSAWTLARALAEYVLTELVPKGLVELAGDDTVTEHPGQRVFGKGCHRDAVRSSHSFTAYRWGHKWVVLAINVKLPGTVRPWALPVLVALYRNKKDNDAAGRRHKTPADLMRQMLCVLKRWFSRRKFVFSGDGGYATHELTEFSHEHSPHLTLVSKFYPDANLYDPPGPPRGGKGRPRVKGQKQLTPAEVVAQTKRKTLLTVNWYGGTTRQVAIVTGVGHWYKSGARLVPIRWVYVEDRTGTRRTEYFYTTDLNLSPREIIEHFTGRWSIEVTFEEARAHVGLETTRGWCERTVLRAEPLLLGLYSVAALWYAALPRRDRELPGVRWIGKTHVTFSDAITAVRRWLWREWIFENPHWKAVFQKIPNHRKNLLLNALSTAA